MKKSKLFENAVLDAERILKVAEENAKLIIGEEVRSTVSGIVSKKINESADAVTEDEVKEETVVESDDEDKEEVEEVVNPGSSEIDAPDNKKPSAASNSSSNAGPADSSTEVHPMGEGEEIDENDSLDEDIAAVLKELSEDTVTEDDELDIDDLLGGDDGDDDSSSSDMGDGDAAAEVAHQGSTGPDSDDQISMATGDDDELDLSELVKQVQAEEAMEKDNKAFEEIAAENVALKESLDEYRKAFKFLRGKLNEINVLNSKLLYTNKIFRGYNSLTTEQKSNVVKTFDRAGTIREVKLVYTTLAESLKSKSGVNRAAKVVAEGLSSAATGTVKHQNLIKEEETILAEGQAQAERFKFLAGLTKNKQ